MFYDLFCELCEKKGVSPTRAALEIGLSKATPTSWKNKGITPQAAQLQKIASYFGVSVDSLLGIKQKEKPAKKGGQNPDIENAKIALFGGDGDVTDEMWEEAIFAAQLIKERHMRKKE